MPVELKHAMKPDMTLEEAARARFVSGARSFILNDLAADMRTAYDARAAAAFARARGQRPADGEEVHLALRGDPAFQVYSALRVQAQRMVWAAVSPVVDRELDRLQAAAAAVEGEPGEVTLDPDVEPPRNVTAIDVHLLPGSYVRGGLTLEGGAVYDQGLAVFSMGLMGDNLDDIGSSISTYVRARFPAFQPAAILDVGCTIGHNTVPWKRVYPEADLHAVDVSATSLLYGSARAKMQGQAIHFHQMSAETLKFPDQSFDLVFSSMFLHEISHKTRAQLFEEAHRVLRPGGLMLHMELPPNAQLSPFEQFYLDWDGHYNEEPFYKGFRDEDPLQLCVGAGFREEDYLQFVTPSIGGAGEEAVRAAAEAADAGVVDAETTGRLAEGVRWFAFGAWKN